MGDFNFTSWYFFIYIFKFSTMNILSPRNQNTVQLVCVCVFNLWNKNLE